MPAAVTDPSFGYHAATLPAALRIVARAWMTGLLRWAVLAALDHLTSLTGPPARLPCFAPPCRRP